MTKRKWRIVYSRGNRIVAEVVFLAETSQRARREFWDWLKAKEDINLDEYKITALWPA